MHVLVCAGESSGDMHAASVMQALRQHQPDIRISAVAGQAMREQGCEVVEVMESLNVMGLSDVLKALPRIRKVGQKLVDWVDEQRPDVVILVDFPGFHMRFGEKVRALGIPVLYYIAPKLWAWGKWRVKRLQRAQDALASILPFEPRWFAARGVTATYVGNPSAYACQGGMTQVELKQRLGMRQEQPLLALLPGSRRSEMERHSELLIETYHRLKQDLPDLVAVTTRAPSMDDAAMQPWRDVGIHVLNRMEKDYAMRADAAIAVSGTATLELALWHTPTVLVYKAAPVTMWIGRKLVGTHCVGLANIILDDTKVMPELLQEQATVDALHAEALRLLEPGSEAAAQQRRHFQELDTRLGLENPADKVAVMALEMVS